MFEKTQSLKLLVLIDVGECENQSEKTSHAQQN